jgi:uncharacterized damage-inducible protein DinB
MKKMTPLEMIRAEFESEALTTKKMLSVVPDDKYDWQPHVKSMTVGRLAAHVAELPTWIKLAVTTEELDFAKGDYKEENPKNTADLLAVYDKNLAVGREYLDKMDDELMGKPWTIRNGETIYATMNRYELIRNSIAQTIHHRAQLGVFMRLLNVPIPGSYGPSADQMNF